MSLSVRTGNHNLTTSSRAIHPWPNAVPAPSRGWWWWWPWRPQLMKHDRPETTTNNKKKRPCARVVGLGSPCPDCFPRFDRPSQPSVSEPNTGAMFTQGTALFSLKPPSVNHDDSPSAIPHRLLRRRPALSAKRSNPPAGCSHQARHGTADASTGPLPTLYSCLLDPP
ncbi:unnamed protein product [Periconia digitata]|uniref:Uncharacterized protein n=1 Tax=Periconia digitata TaxID=1303443 RepID=A0A9W4XRV8_9PLEO|nr:unnamed protein product [Periconia digitata]